MTTRRRVVLALGATALATPLGVRAQRRLWTIGLLWNDSVNPSPHVATFLNAMQKKGYVLDRDIRIENRVSGEGYRHMDQGASDLVGAKADAIVTIGLTATLAAAKATGQIPIVGIVGVDPTAHGLAKSLAHPQGNFTGVTTLGTDLRPKRFQLLHELLPRAKRIGLLVATESRAAALRENEAGARLFGLQTQVAEVRLPSDLDGAVAKLSKARVDALFVSGGTMLAAHGARIAALAMQYRLPSVYSSVRPVEAGGLLSYSPDTSEMVRQLAAYVDRILKGGKPAEMPIEQASRFELAINLKTAKALGIKVPQSILVQVSKVIE